MIAEMDILIMVMLTVITLEVLVILFSKGQRLKHTPKELPFVTVQIPTYNESVEHVLKAITSIHYPKDKLEIQILDDSTDKEIKKNNMVACEEYKRLGFEISAVYREGRENFKAGALDNATPSARGEIIAMFDVDHVPFDKDFLSEGIKYFSDDVGIIKTGVTSDGKSFLEKLYSLTYLMFNHYQSKEPLFVLCPSALLVKKSILKDVGGWSSALGEDADLGIRTVLAGKKIVYVPHIATRIPAPPSLKALGIQQHRWAFGGLKFSLGT